MTIPMKRSALIFAALMLSVVGAEAAMLTAQNGMTIYTFDKDTAGVSTCYDDCAKEWPPYLGKEGDTLTEGWTLVKRTDDTMQLAHKGKPVYFFEDDKKKGDMAGDGHDGLWHVINE
jgi:predicted lipoprotein with Yx(FWY)xxD motif